MWVSVRRSARYLHSQIVWRVCFRAKIFLTLIRWTDKLLNFKAFLRFGIYHHLAYTQDLGDYTKVLFSWEINLFTAIYKYTYLSVIKNLSNLPFSIEKNVLDRIFQSRSWPIKISRNKFIIWTGESVNQSMLKKVVTTHFLSIIYGHIFFVSGDLWILLRRLHWLMINLCKIYKAWSHPMAGEQSHFKSSSRDFEFKKVKMTREGVRLWSWSNVTAILRINFNLLKNILVD